ncbi:hypothetical protein AB0P15_18290 [Streptomyces sp. NPDC087917]|uniref:hypothetical protein n=1 Tax=Streptomyces sp. NPDC087917 TaxID=3155060 RepID=UPI003421AE18
MSTPEEQQSQRARQQAEERARYERQQREQQQPERPDAYGAQTWQGETWDTSYQPVQPPLGSVPGQSAPVAPAAPVAPEGWFREEPAAQPQPPQQEHQYQQFQQPQPWPDGSAAAEQTAYLPPVQAEAEQQQPQQQVYGQQQPAPVAPEGWFREEPAQPYEQLQPQQPPYEQSPYEQPYGQAQEQQPQEPWAAPAAPWPEAAPAAEQTAYLPPVPSGQQPVTPDGWFREEAPAAPAAPQEWAVERTAYLPPQAPAEEPAVERTAYMPPYPGPQEAPEAPAGGPGPLAAPAGPAAEYSPPTLGGNTLRAVDPAQARAEGRSPIIDPGPQPAILTAALGLLLAAAAALGDLALLVPLVLLQGLTAAGWFRLNGMWPARQGIALAFAGAVVADAAVLAVDESYGPGAIIGTLGAWVLLTLVLQLRSHADPDERMYGLMASVTSAALAIICAGYLAADADAVSVGAAAVAVAVFARALPLPTVPSVAVSLAAAAGAGIAVGTVTGIGAGGALLGLAAGVCALVGLRVAAYDYPSKFVHMTAGVALPLAAAAPAVYLIGRVVG